MPWERKTVDNQRSEFVARATMGEESLSALCRKYGISRPTGYKWLERYKGGETMLDRPHTPFRKPFKTSPDVELRIVDVRAAHPTWGARKIQRFLVDKGENSVPAASTINDILKRNGCISELASEQHTPWKRFARDPAERAVADGLQGPLRHDERPALPWTDDSGRSLAVFPVPRREGKRTMGRHKGQSGPRFRGIRNSRRDFVRQRRTPGQTTTAAIRRLKSG